jgi:hypothetical protein
VVYDSGFPLGAKLSIILRKGSWHWPFACSKGIVEIQSSLNEVIIGDADLPVWNSSNGIYSRAATWEVLREKKPIVIWWKLVWFSIAIPKHSFTKQRMCAWVMLVLIIAFLVMVVWRAVIISSFTVDLADGYGILLFLIVGFLILLLIGIQLWCGVLLSLRVKVEKFALLSFA